MRRPEMRATLRNGRTDWYSIVMRAPAAEPRTADVFIYDEIGYMGVTASDFARELAALDVDTIHLKINSPGGEVFDGVAIHNALKNHPAKVAVTVDALAASAASFIAMAGDTVHMARGSQMMIHNAHGLCIGDENDMEALVARLRSIGDTIASFYSERAGGDVAQWRAVMAAETWYTGEEAVAAGLADTFDDPPKAAAKTPAPMWDLSIFTHAGRAEAPAPAPITPAPAVDSRPEDPFSAFVAQLSGGGHQ